LILHLDGVSEGRVKDEWRTSDRLLKWRVVLSIPPVQFSNVWPHF